MKCVEHDLHFSLLHVLPAPLEINLFNNSSNAVCVTSKGSDQPAHTRSLIWAFACH